MGWANQLLRIISLRDKVGGGSGVLEALMVEFVVFLSAPGQYDPKMLDTSRKVTIRQRLDDFKPDQNPGRKKYTGLSTIVTLAILKHFFQRY